MGLLRIQTALETKEVCHVADPPSKLRMGPLRALASGSTSKSGGRICKAIHILSHLTPFLSPTLLTPPHTCTTPYTFAPPHTFTRPYTFAPPRTCTQPYTFAPPCTFTQPYTLGEVWPSTSLQGTRLRRQSAMKTGPWTWIGNSLR